MYVKHGLTGTPHFNRWSNMMDRCYNPECKAYANYGGRGIGVCERWHNPRTFVAELPDGYEPGLELDRIDNDGNYEPGNIRWATRRQNTANRRTARLITSNGRTQSLTEWARETGLPKTVIWDRIDEQGWTPERALSEPIADRMENIRRVQSLRWAGHVKKPKPKPRVLRRFPYKGREMTVREISDETGIPFALLRKRLCERNWPVEKATSKP